MPMPVTLDDLIEATRRLADSNFATAAALNKLIPSWEQLRRDVYDIKNSREMDQAKIDLAIGKLNTDLVLLLDNVRHAQTDVRELQRDVTGAFPLQKHDDRSSIEKIIAALEKSRPSTKLLVFILLLALTLSGWLTHILNG